VRAQGLAAKRFLMTNAPYEIASARPEEWSAALELALQHVPDDERPTRHLNALALLGAGEIDPHGIFVARTASGLVGVQVCIPLRGKSTLFWLPEISPVCDDALLADRLVRAALDWALQGGAKLAQTLVEPRASAHTAPLLHCGFRRVTDLQYFEHALVQLPPLILPKDLQLEPFTKDIKLVFERTLLSTYDATLDCPELNGVRTIEDILDGHRAQGVWHPETWWLARLGGKSVGVAMLTELFDGDGWDLSYVGVTPQYRGRGLGKALTVHALQAAQQRGAARLLVAVDRRNRPALQMYASLGFAATARRDVLLYIPSA
jgi:mycothiol synthase